MRNCSVFLDDDPVLIDGEFVIDDLKASRSTFGSPSVTTA